MSSLDLASLQTPLPAWHPKAWYYGTARFLLGTVGRLSAGIRIGLAHGFDSGVMLDHVYENRAAGIGPLGRLIDRVYLNAPGWAGIRNRGDLLRTKIADTLRHLSADRGEIVLADLACGGGRYVLGALQDVGADVRVRAILRDYRDENVETARANAARLGLSVTVERADAFSDADLGRLPRPDVVVVSGLHEIVEDDGLVRNHFAQIARLLPAGGRLVLTIQPDHPQLEFIARVLVSHTGRPWTMRLRPVELTRAWIEAAGLQVLDVEMEPKGIFGVIVARKA